MKLKTIVICSLSCTLVGAMLGLVFFENKIDFSSLAQVPAGPTKNICSITINSDDEIKTFKQKLSSDGRFQFTELTSSSEKWFDQACSSNVQCDVLIISGHFGRTFFGRSGNILTLSEIESKSCSKTCRGILEQPKEIYLFGCNTLAGKGPASRTADQYLQVLLEDGLERSFAERVVEARYGPSGELNVSSMRRAFSGVPVIYGFCDKAPLGAETGPVLQKYLSGKSKNDYFDRLNKLEGVKKTLQPYSLTTMQQLIDAPLANSFKSIGRCFKQVTGVAPTDEIANRICEVRDTQKPIETRARDLNFLMRSDERLSYIELCNDFFAEMSKKALTPTELSAVAEIKKNQKLRDDLEMLLDKVTFFLGFDYGVLGIRLGLDQQKVIPVLSRGFVKMVTKGLTQEEINLMINLDFRNSFKDYIRINFEAINYPMTWSNGHSIEAIGLTKTQDAQIINHLQQMLSTSAPQIKRQLLGTLIKLNAVNIAMKSELISMLYAPQTDTRANAIRALGTIKVYDEKIVTEIIALMNRETDGWTLKKSALYFSDVPFDNPLIQNHLAKSLSHPNAEVRQYSALALAHRQLKDDEVLKALVLGLKDLNSSVKLNCRFALQNNRQMISAYLVSQILTELPEEYKLIFSN